MVCFAPRLTKVLQRAGSACARTQILKRARCPCVLARRHTQYSRRDSNPQSPPQEGVALSIRPREQTHSLALERISEGLCRVCCSRDVPDPRRQSGMILAPVRKPRSRGIGILFLPPTKGEGTTPRGFEPLRAEPNGFRVHLLSRSDTVSCLRGARRRLATNG